MTPAARKVPPMRQLEGVLTVLDNRSKRPTAEVIQTVRTMVREALDVLQEPDATKRRVEFILLAISQSTRIVERKRGAGTVRLARIVDPTLYHWAIDDIHRLAAGQ